MSGMKKTASGSFRSSVPAKDSRFSVLAFLLPALGLILILPPLVFLPSNGDSFLGVPANIAYIFGVWLALIVGAFWLQRLAHAGEEKPVDMEPDRFDD